MSTEHWILEGREAVPADLMTWARWFEKAMRHVGKDEVNGYHVSTVFLGIDHSFGDGPPLLFESMVFKGEDWGDIECKRYSTYDEAEAGHKALVDKYRALAE